MNSTHITVEDEFISREDAATRLKKMPAAAEQGVGARVAAPPMPLPLFPSWKPGEFPPFKLGEEVKYQRSTGEWVDGKVTIMNSTHITVEDEFISREDAATRLKKMPAAAEQGVGARVAAPPMPLPIVS